MALCSYDRDSAELTAGGPFSHANALVQFVKVAGMLNPRRQDTLLAFAIEKRNSVSICDCGPRAAAKGSMLSYMVLTRCTLVGTSTVLINPSTSRAKWLERA